MPAEPIPNNLCSLFVFNFLQGKVSKEAFEEALKEAFPVKDDENIEALMQAAVAELKAEEADTLEYQVLFTEVRSVMVQYSTVQ